jgi:AcrR family transcriptional regulator
VAATPDDGGPTVAQRSDEPDPGNLPDVDELVVDGQERPSDRVPLSRERILSTALRSIDEEGLAALTMRRLGARLGVEAMSLYRYVPGREALLDGVVDALVGELDHDADVLRSPEHGWQDFLQRMAHGVRRVAIAHPKAFPLVASTPPEAPWLRPPLRSISWVETFLSGLVQQGFSDQEAVAAYRAFTSFLLGNLLLEVSQRGGAVGPLDLVDEEEPVGGLDDAPIVRRLARRLGEDRALQEFEESLESLIDRISAQVLGGSGA